MSDHFHSDRKLRKNVSFNELVDVIEFDDEENATCIYSTKKQEIKKFNGIPLTPYIVDNIINDYFDVHNIKTVDDVEQSLNRSFDMFILANPDATDVLSKEIIVNVKNIIQDACTKISDIALHNPEKCICVVNNGGSRGSQISSAHIPHMKRLIHLITCFIDIID